MSHASMLKARRKRQKTLKLLHGADKQAKRLAKEALEGPKKPKVKKERIKKEKVQVEKVKKVKPTKEELGKQEANAKKGAAVAKKTAAA